MNGFRKIIPSALDALEMGWGFWKLNDSGGNRSMLRAGVGSWKANMVLEDMASTLMAGVGLRKENMVPPLIWWWCAAAMLVTKVTLPPC